MAPAVVAFLHCYFSFDGQVGYVSLLFFCLSRGCSWFVFLDSWGFGYTAPVNPFSYDARVPSPGSTDLVKSWRITSADQLFKRSQRDIENCCDLSR
jgi:hypothetical protein